MRFHRFFSHKNSKSFAKDRLKVLLISDRINCSPERMEMMKNDLAKVISKYMKIDANRMDIQIKQSEKEQQGENIASLSANIPILDMYK